MIGLACCDVDLDYAGGSVVWEWCCVRVCQILNMSSNDKQNDAFHEIRLFSLFPAKSDMLWYDLRGIQLPWSVPRECRRRRPLDPHTVHQVLAQFFP